jgi:hypothetical protein
MGLEYRWSASDAKSSLIINLKTAKASQCEIRC